MKSKIKAAVVGCGHLGMIHCRLLNEISSQNNKVQFTGVFDIDAGKISDASTGFNIKAFKNIDELIKENDAIIIAASTISHYGIAEKGIKNNKHLFIEKPITETPSQAKQLKELLKGKELKVQVGHVERYNPALQALKNYEITPKFIEAHRLSQFNPRGTDVSVVQDLMIHDIDIILSLVKSEVKSIDANGVPVISDNIDIANARIKFENGCVANLTSSRISINKMRKLRIFQPNSYISLDFLNNKSEVFRLTSMDEDTGSRLTYPVSAEKKIVYDIPQPEENLNPIKRELEHFFSSIRNNTPVDVSLDDGMKAVEIADKIIKSIEVQNVK
jgi:predicted dehydrogenase